jgi:hypothetical protein
MDTAFISAFSALGGSIFGGLTAGVTTWMSLRSQARAGHRLHRVQHREELYREFIIAASTAFGDSMVNNEPRIQDFVVLYSMVSRMRVVSSPPVTASAEAVVSLVIDSYFEANRTILELHALIKSGQSIDPLRHFSETARAELARME